jgi:hypothetical protein
LIVDAIVIMTVGDLLVLLLWHCAFKHLIPKESRKASYKKGKLASAFEEMAVVGVLDDDDSLLPSLRSSIASLIISTK